MASIPDHFDLWVRKAQQMPEERQLDCLLGSLFAGKEWFFYNQGVCQTVDPAMVELDGVKCLMLFSSADKMFDFVQSASCRTVEQLPSIAIPAEKGAEFCLQFRAAGAEAILVNPGDYAFRISFDALESFARDREAHRAEARRGFWIPNMTSEEEDFWQEHGL
jgi:hypothetical protein